VADAFVVGALAAAFFFAVAFLAGEVAVVRFTGVAFAAVFLAGAAFLAARFFEVDVAAVFGATAGVDDAAASAASAREAPCALTAATAVDNPLANGELDAGIRPITCFLAASLSAGSTSSRAVWNSRWKPAETCRSWLIVLPI
jgi:hypothetical protein